MLHQKRAFLKLGPQRKRMVLNSVKFKKLNLVFQKVVEFHLEKSCFRHYPKNLKN